MKNNLYIRGQKTAPFRVRMNNGRSVFRSRKPRASAHGASLLLVVFAIVMIWSFTPQAYSMERRPSAKKTSVAKTAAQIYKASGKVTAFSAKNSTITISRNAASPLIINIDKNTLFYKGGKNVKSTEIKIGDFVAVRYETRKNLNMAKSIRVLDKAATVTKK